MNNDKFKKLCLYGGVTREEYNKTRLLTARYNLRIWKISSIFFEILFSLSFVISMLIAYAFPAATELKETFRHAVIPLGIGSLYLIIVSFVFYTMKPFSRSLLPLIYITDAMIFLCIGSISAINPTVTGAAFLVVLVVLPFFITDRPLRYSIFTLSIVLIYIAIIVITNMVRFNNMNSDSTINVILASIFAIVSVFVSFVLNISRIKHNVDIYDVEIQRDTDPLTGVKNNNAYERKVDDLKTKIRNHENIKFAILVFDINDLKATNDQFGHNAGDKLIVRSARLICEQFKRSPVYRIGGDEFVVILENSDYANREALIRELHEMIDRIHRQSTSLNNDTSLAFGVAVFNPNKDFDYTAIFSRADAEMYENKKFIKNKQNLQ